MNKASFIDHLEELRKRILYSIAVAGIFAVAGFFVAKPVLDFIIQRVNVGSAYFFSPTEAFTAQVKVALFLGIFAAFPFIIVQTWLFIGPGLTEKEQKVSMGYIISGILLFLIGVTFAYFILIPFGLRFLLSFGSENLKPIMNISGVLSFVLWCLLGCGIMFQLPLLVFTLIRLDIVRIATVTKHRAEAIVAILIICAVITPTADMFTLLIISVPLIILFELSILAARISLRSSRKP
ncbi:MAG TPA: twin-arginine translocase subunit TatC [bacterium]